MRSSFCLRKLLFAWLLLHIATNLQLETHAFVKSLLKSPPLLNRKDLWRRSEYNAAVYGNFSLTLTRSLQVPTPSYVQILQNNQLTITSFSLLRKGSIMEFDLTDHSSPKTYQGDFLWPNELSTYVDSRNEQILLVPDGFLFPGQSDGGIYAMRQWHHTHPHHSTPSPPIRLTAHKEGWFYHRAMYLKLPGGREGILTARAQKSLLGGGKGELVWLNLPPSGLSAPDVPLPLEEVVLKEGPDVMFDVIDLDKSDDCIEVVCAHFFGRELSVHSIQPLPHHPYVHITHTSRIETVGRPYGICFASFAPPEDDRPTNPDSSSSSSSSSSTCLNNSPTHLLVTTHECSYDIPSAINMVVSTLKGDYPKVKTNHKQSVKMNAGDSIGSTHQHQQQFTAGRIKRGEGLVSGLESPHTLSGGSLFAYELTRAKDKSDKVKIKKDITSWKRSTLFKGFKVRGWGGIFSPGAPGFPYVFHMPHKPQSPPLILLAGDCTGSAYLFAPRSPASPPTPLPPSPPSLPRYDLAFEVECGATVGSAAVESVADDSGDVHLYIPAYELNKVHVFRLTDLEPKSSLAPKVKAKDLDSKSTKS